VRLSGGARLTDLAIITGELQARDRDRWLACLYAPASARPGLFALFALDCELAQLVASTIEPMLGEIRLAWWRERLEELDAGKAPAQPLLVALRDHALPVLRGAELAGLEDRWLPLIGSDDVPPAHVEGGGHLFALAARLLGGDEGHAQDMGRAWVLGEPLLQYAPPPLRPLAGLVALSARDAARARAGSPREARGSLPRQWRLLKSVALGR
jgi:phytoene synthase